MDFSDWKYSFEYNKVNNRKVGENYTTDSLKYKVSMLYWNQFLLRSILLINLLKI